MSLPRVLAKTSQTLRLYHQQDRLLSTVSSSPKLSSFGQQTRVRVFAYVEHMRMPAMSFCGLILATNSLINSPSAKDMEKVIAAEEFGLEENFYTTYDAVKERMDIQEREMMKKRREQERIQDIYLKMLGQAVENLDFSHEMLMMEKRRLEAEKKELEQHIKQLQKKRSKGGEGNALKTMEKKGEE